MTGLLIAIVYISFISLGLPDSLLGTAWPLMHLELNTANEMAGIVAFTVSASTVASSLFSSRFIRRFGTGKVTLFSVLSTLIGLTGYAISKQLWLLFPSAVFLGIGAGAVDTALSNFAALHFQAKHMSWLHCFWGIGAMGGTYIMAFFLKHQQWRTGFLGVAGVLVLIILLLLFSRKLWKIYENESAKEEAVSKPVTNRDAIKQKNVKSLMLAMFCNNGYEMLISVWIATYFISEKGIAVETAAAYCSMLYFGITAGRLLSGLLTARVSDRNLIRFGILIALAGIVLIIIPAPGIISAAGLFIIGFGASPVFPSILHMTPEKYGERYSAAVIGLEMSAAYVGAAYMPAISGFLLERIGMRFVPYILLLLFALMLLSTEIAGRDSHNA